jgi:hypothetical protein
MSESTRLFVWNFAQSIVGSLVRSSITITMGWVSLRWPTFDKLLSPITADPMTIAGIVAGVTAFLMAIASAAWTWMHSNKAVAKALDAAAVAVETKPQP